MAYYHQPSPGPGASSFSFPSLPSPSSSPVMRPLYTSCCEHFRSLSPSNSTRSHSASAPLPTAIEEMACSSENPSRLLQLPTEIRLQIYSLLLLPNRHKDLRPNYAKANDSAPDSFDYDKCQRASDRQVTSDLTRPTLFVRTIDGTRYPLRFPEAHHIRSNYSVRGDRFRARTMPTTYHVLNVPPQLAYSKNLLSVSPGLHAEAAELLYANYTFDFDTHIEAIVPFLRDLTPQARACIRRIRLVKRALPYEKEFDRAEWAEALYYLSDPDTGLQLRGLHLGVVAGRPGLQGWEDTPRYEAGAFEFLKDADGMDWMLPLLALKRTGTLRELEVEAVVEHCPPAYNSAAMARFIRFSASVESGFAEYMRQQLL